MSKTGKDIPATAQDSVFDVSISAIADRARSLLSTHAADLSDATTRISTPANNDQALTALAAAPRDNTAAVENSLPVMSLTNHALDAHKSLQELSKQNLIIDKTGGPTDSTLARATEQSRGQSDAPQSPSVKIDFAPLDAAGANKPDFLVKKDGSIEMLNNPELSKQKNIVVNVERETGQSEPSEAQKAALSSMTGYLNDRLKLLYPEAAGHGVKIEDKQGVLPEEARREIAGKNGYSAGTGTENLSAPAQRAVQDMNRAAGNNRMTPAQASEYFPAGGDNLPRPSERREPTEQEAVAVLKDMVAAFASKGDAQPYAAIHHRSDAGWAFGRYGVTYELMSNWLDNVNVENLAELEKQGKVPKGTAARLKLMKESLKEFRKSGDASKLDPFLAKLKAGDKNQPLTTKDLAQNLMGPEVQELIANDMIRHFGSLSNDAGKIGVSMYLGREASAADLEQNKALADGYRQAALLAAGKNLTPSGEQDFASGNINKNIVSAAENSVGKAMWKDHASVVAGGRYGCAATVSEILQLAHASNADSASVTDLSDQLQRKGWTLHKLSSTKVSPGDVVYGLEPGASSSGSGHIGIAGINGIGYDNSSKEGVLKKRSTASWLTADRFGDERFVLKPPTSKK